MSVYFNISQNLSRLNLFIVKINQFRYKNKLWIITSAQSLEKSRIESHFNMHHLFLFHRKQERSHVMYVICFNMNKMVPCLFSFNYFYLLPVYSDYYQQFRRLLTSYSLLVIDYLFEVKSFLYLFYPHNQKQHCYTDISRDMILQVLGFFFSKQGVIFQVELLSLCIL